MKLKFLLLLFFVFSALLISCKKDSVSNNITGKWYFEKDIYTQYQNDVEVSSSQDTSFTASDFIQFNSNGSGTLSKRDTSGIANVNSLNYILSGTQITINIDLADGGISALLYTITNSTSTALTLHQDQTTISNGVSYRVVEDVFYNK